MRRQNGFTMIELLVVIAVICILVAIGVPLLARARGMALQAGCLSNLRHLGMGAASYCADNHGALPAAANLNVELNNDFVFWQADRNANVRTQSALASYLGWANASATLPAMLCPADNLSRNLTPVYPYSYTMNAYICGNSASQSSGFPLSKATQFYCIDNPSNKILFLEEDGASMDDGSANLDPTVAGISGSNATLALLSARHATGWQINPDSPNSDGYVGNVVFCDGHAGGITRAKAHSADSFNP